MYVSHPTRPPLRCRCICECRNKLDGEYKVLREQLGTFWFNNIVCLTCYDEAMDEREYVI